MNLRFEQPECLWLILAALPMAWAALWAFRAMAGVRRWAAIVTRTLLIAVLAAMLAGATSIRTTQRLAVIALVDVSGSVRAFGPGSIEPDSRPTVLETAAGNGAPVPILERIKRYLVRATEKRGPDDFVGLVVFDGHSTAVAACTAGSIADRTVDLVGAEGTDIASAIRLAQGMIPPDAAGRLLLISDGNQTTGDAARAARSAIRSGKPIPIDVAPVHYEVTREVIVDSIESPTRAPANAQVSVRITLTSTGPAAGMLRLRDEQQDLDINGAAAGTGRIVALSAGKNVFVADVTLGPGRVHRLEAVFEPDADAQRGGDTIASNNRALSFTLTPGAGAILLVDGVSKGAADGPGAILARTLRTEGLEVEVVSPESMPGDLLRLQTYDAVLLQNVSAESLAPGCDALLARYVTDLGGGLVMIGGPDSFGPGGWKGTELEALLPVRLDLPERLVMPAAAVIFIIDKSGSMERPVLGGSRTQQEIANAGTAMAIRTLDKNDLVGVIAFDNTTDVIVPLGKNTDPPRTTELVMSISAGGGTNLPPAMEEALRQFKGVQSQVKHVIIMSDGQSRGMGKLPGLARALAGEGIKVSSIAVGDEADSRSLKEIAVIGGGEFYKVADPNILPRVFLKAVRVVRQPMIREEPFTPLLGTRTPLTQGLEAGAIPMLRGLVLTQPKSAPTAAETQSVTYDLLAPGGEPVLAHWQAGLGQVAAFTSDAHHWARDWLAWPGYRRVWTQLVRAVARPTSSRTADLALEVKGDELHLRLEASTEQGQPLDMLSIPGSVYLPDGRRVDVRLSQTGPGVYEAMTPAGFSGTYVVTLTPRAAAGVDRALPPVIGGAVRPPGDEFRALRSDDEFLAGLSRASGGRVFSLDAPPPAATLFDRGPVVPQVARTPLWPILLPIALALVVLDVGMRRVAWDRLFSRDFGATWRREAAAALRDRSAQAASALQTLRGTEARQGPGAAEKTLTAVDARALVEEARSRRRQARQASPPANQATDPAKKPAADEHALRSAKQRALDRFKESE